MFLCVVLVYLFKQKTAYEMRISDWSSDVCSSDLLAAIDRRRAQLEAQLGRDRQLMDQIGDLQEAFLNRLAALPEGRPPGESLRQVRWMLEEFRVSDRKSVV